VPIAHEPATPEFQRAIEADSAHETLRESRSPPDLPQGAALVLGPDARWFVLPSGDRVELGRRRTLRRILLALANEHSLGGKAVSADALLRAGWLGERVKAVAGNARVRVAISTLRSLGLCNLIVKTDDGYLLAPHVAVTIDSKAPGEMPMS
jgi:hypothetical protein